MDLNNILMLSDSEHNSNSNMPINRSRQHLFVNSHGTHFLLTTISKGDVIDLIVVVYKLQH
jgi:hypothetical protein